MKHNLVDEAKSFLTKFDNPTNFEIVDQYERNSAAYYDLVSEHDTLKRLLDDIPRFPSIGLLQDKQRLLALVEKEVHEKQASNKVLQDKIEQEIYDVVDMVSRIKEVISRIEAKRKKLAEIESNLKDKMMENQVTIDQRMQDQQKYQESIFKRQEVLEKLKFKELDLKKVLMSLNNELEVKKEEYKELDNEKTKIASIIDQKEQQLLQIDSKVDAEYQENFAKTNFLKESFRNRDLKSYSTIKRARLFNEIKEQGYILLT
eukprot:NODE_230_length_13723_cov_0.393570.p6 type:complete len:260 gc:universal NODE_230_length_13723_cov_0.393570:6801-6022(-)